MAPERWCRRHRLAAQSAPAGSTGRSWRPVCRPEDAEVSAGPENGGMTASVEPTDSAAATGARDPVAAHSGVVTEESHAALRADIRLLGNLLGETLIASHGQDVLDLV